MKVNIYETVEVSDADRKLIAERLGQRAATRDDLKAFIWQHGADWRQVLTPAVDDGATVDGDDEDLLGTPAQEAEADLPRDAEGWPIEDDEDLI